VEPIPRRRCCAGRVIGRRRANWSRIHDSQYERERFEEVLTDRGRHQVGGEVGLDGVLDADGYVAEWMKEVGKGVAGYQTPKVAVARP